VASCSASLPPWCRIPCTQPCLVLLGMHALHLLHPPPPATYSNPTSHPLTPPYPSPPPQVRVFFRWALCATPAAAAHTTRLHSPPPVIPSLTHPPTPELFFCWCVPLVLSQGGVLFAVQLGLPVPVFHHRRGQPHDHGQCATQDQVCVPVCPSRAWSSVNMTPPPHPSFCRHRIAPQVICHRHQYHCDARHGRRALPSHHCTFCRLPLL
jgi:hypothetical protein